MSNLPPPPRGEGGIKPPLVPASDLWERYRIRKNVVNAAAGGQLPIAEDTRGSGRDSGKARSYNKLAALWWAISSLKRSPNSKVDFRAIDHDYLLMIEAGYTLDGTEPPPDEPEGNAPPPSISEGSAGHFFLEEQLKALGSVEIPEHMRHSARSVAEIGKAISDISSANERQLRLLIDVGRMVHVDEIEVLVRACLDDWVGELRDLPQSIDSKIAAETKLPVKTCRQVLRLVSDYLMTFGQQAIDAVERETAEYISSKQKQRRGT